MIAKEYSAKEIARWFLTWASYEEEEDGLTNLKLQKLLYYAQGQHLAKFGRPLFPEKIEAWFHGPVVPNVYHEYKEFGKSPIDLEQVDDIDLDEIDEDTTSLLAAVWDKYGSLSAWKLREKTHRETPWNDVYDPDVTHIEITQDSIQDYFERPYKERK